MTERSTNTPCDVSPPATDEDYARAERNVLRLFAPRVRPCGHCGWPFPQGYVCNTCGFDNSDAEVSNG